DHTAATHPHRRDIATTDSDIVIRATIDTQLVLALADTIVHRHATRLDRVEHRAIHSHRLPTIFVARFDLPQPDSRYTVITQLRTDFVARASRQLVARIATSHYIVHLGEPRIVIARRLLEPHTMH